MPKQTRRLSIFEAVAIAGVVMSALGGLLLFASNITDRFALMEERITLLRHDVDTIENGSPMVNARLERQRTDLTEITQRLEEVRRHCDVNCKSAP